MPLEDGTPTNAEAREERRQARVAEERVVPDEARAAAIANPKTPADWVARAKHEYPDEELWADLRKMRAEKLGITEDAVDNLDRLIRVLGRGVHVEAVFRLVQLWPDAYVKVEHQRYNRADGNTDIEPPTGTVLYIYESKPSGNGDESDPPMYVYGESQVVPPDQFVKRTGIQIAFSKALKEVQAWINPPPPIKCTRCNRVSPSGIEGQTDTLIQPDGRPCGGVFRVAVAHG